MQFRRNRKTGGTVSLQEALESDREGPRKAAAFQMKRQNQKLCGKKLQKR